jgi:hypothetical protein
MEDIITLKNGAKINLGMYVDLLSNLEKLEAQNRSVFDELVKKCKDPSYTMPADAFQELYERNFVQRTWYDKSGMQRMQKIHGSIEDIVNSDQEKILSEITQQNTNENSTPRPSV